MNICRACLYSLPEHFFLLVVFFYCGPGQVFKSGILRTTRQVATGLGEKQEKSRRGNNLGFCDFPAAEKAEEAQVLERQLWARFKNDSVNKAPEVLYSFMLAALWDGYHPSQPTSTAHRAKAAWAFGTFQIVARAFWHFLPSSSQLPSEVSILIHFHR